MTLAIIALSGCVRHDPMVVSGFQATLGGGRLNQGQMGQPSSTSVFIANTDCEAFVEALWQAAGIANPFDVSAANTQLGDACDPFNSKHPVRVP